jgi:hypothetical protein
VPDLAGQAGASASTGLPAGAARGILDYGDWGVARAISEEIRRALASAHAEALAVGDSTVRADRLAQRIAELSRSLLGADLPDDTRARLRAALSDAERVLRRDDDGREAARHLQSAIRHTDDRPRPPSPF